MDILFVAYKQKDTGIGLFGVNSNTEYKFSFDISDLVNLSGYRICSIRVQDLMESSDYMNNLERISTSLGSSAKDWIFYNQLSDIRSDNE